MQRRNYLEGVLLLVALLVACYLDHQAVPFTPLTASVAAPAFVAVVDIVVMAYWRPVD